MSNLLFGESPFDAEIVGATYRTTSFGGEMGVELFVEYMPAPHEIARLQPLRFSIQGHALCGDATQEPLLDDDGKPFVDYEGLAAYLQTMNGGVNTPRHMPNASIALMPDSDGKRVIISPPGVGIAAGSRGAMFLLAMNALRGINPPTLNLATEEGGGFVGLQCSIKQNIVDRGDGRPPYMDTKIVGAAMKPFPSYASADQFMEREESNEFGGTGGVITGFTT